MDKISLAAGGGELPLEFVKSAKAKGLKVVVFAVEDVASPLLEKEADKVYWLKFGELSKVIFALLKERVRTMAILGKITRDVIYNKSEYDSASKDMFSKMNNKRDYSIMEGVTKKLAIAGIKVIDPSEYLSHLYPAKGTLGNITPSAQDEIDMKWGFDIAKHMAGKDIGQTVIVKEGTVIAIEAIEGTNAVIERAGKLAGAGCIMVKVSRPDQDMRWDVPTIGYDTIKKLVDNKFKGIALESGRMYFMQRDESLKLSNDNNLVIKAF